MYRFLSEFHTHNSLQLKYFRKLSNMAEDTSKALVSTATGILEPQSRFISSQVHAPYAAKEVQVTSYTPHTTKLRTLEKSFVSFPITD